MLCSVYKSTNRADSYLYINKRDQFDDVPKELMKVFGVPKLVMQIPLSKRTHLAGADLTKVKAALQESGYYLQLPPPVLNLLTQYKADLLSSTETE